MTEGVSTTSVELACDEARECHAVAEYEPSTGTYELVCGQAVAESDVSRVLDRPLADVDQYSCELCLDPVSTAEAIRGDLA